MFDTLSDKLQRVFKNLRGEGKLSAENMEAALREIRVALLEADVHFRVVKQLIEGIREKALGQEVLDAFSPGQQVIKIVRDELIKMLGSHQSRLRFANEPPSVIMIVGLQGSGKTTSAGKLARWLSKNGHNPILVSVDVYRPAARQQLAVLAREIKLPIYAGAPEETKPADLARSARREAVQTGRDVLLVDTAGRLHIDEELMLELRELRDQLAPSEILFVADAMTGQDAVKSADAFHQELGITGVILTKMDGDARGGAALSVRSVTGQPLKFVGLGEKSDAFEPFHPDRVASRILGMGDVLSFIEKVEETMDQKKTEEMQRKLIDNEFTLEDFRDQLRQIRKLGPARIASRHDAQHRPHEGSEECEGGRRRDHPHRRDDRFDDRPRARQPHDHQRRPPPPNRQGQRHHGSGRQQPAQAIHASPQNDEEFNRRRLSWASAWASSSCRCCPSDCASRAPVVVR